MRCRSPDYPSDFLIVPRDNLHNRVTYLDYGFLFGKRFPVSVLGTERFVLTLIFRRAKHPGYLTYSIARAADIYFTIYIRPTDAYFIVQLAYFKLHFRSLQRAQFFPRIRVRNAFTSSVEDGEAHADPYSVSLAAIDYELAAIQYSGYFASYQIRHSGSSLSAR